MSRESRRPMLAAAYVAGLVVLSFSILLNTACGLFRARFERARTPVADPAPESRQP